MEWEEQATWVVEGVAPAQASPIDGAMARLEVLQWDPGKPSRAGRSRAMRIWTKFREVVEAN